MKALVILALALGITAAAASSRPAAAQLAARRGQLSIDQLIDIRHPSSPTWSPDGRWVAFVWDRAGVSRVYLAPADRTTPPRALDQAGSSLTGAFWSADGHALMIPREGDLWRVPIDAAGASAVWTTPSAEVNITPAPDATRVAFARDGALVVRELANGRETTLARDLKNVGNVSWSPDGSHVVYATGAQAIRHEQTPAYSGSKIIYTINENVPGQTFVVAAAGGTPKPLAVVGGFGPRRWIDATHFVFDRVSADFKRRTVYVVDIAGALRQAQGSPSDQSRAVEPRAIHDDVEQTFWSITGDANAAAQPSPDGKWIAFLSDRDGWDHLYVMPARGGEPVQITKGKFEAWRPQWSPDSQRIAFDANLPDHYGTRHLYIATIGADPSRASIAQVTTGSGTNVGPTWSPDGKRLLYQHTDANNSADLYVVDANAGAPVRLTDSMPSTVDRSVFVAPEMIHYAGPDGQQVPAWLFVPKNLDRSKKHPAIVWIHGDGINQNYDGWHVQRNYAVYYSFHQLLLQKGYVVIAPDYRGSIGYGRQWREGVYMDVGGKDAKDAWMAANYLKTLPYVDTTRVGVWGLSYGGFFTLIAITDQPKLFRAAVDVAGVVDYAMYYEDPYHGGWTTSRIGTPEQHPEVYANASPISHVDRLETPLLVLHGTADVNVPYLHSVRLIDELMKKGKGQLVSFMTYPGEFHYFTREHVLRDAWRRVDEFFEIHLKAGPTPSH
jgi:dipeptidyl aminopeptidase/acylaminoacyl peptidase